MQDQNTAERVTLAEQVERAATAVAEAMGESTRLRLTVPNEVACSLLELELWAEAIRAGYVPVEGEPLELPSNIVAALARIGQEPAGEAEIFARIALQVDDDRRGLEPVGPADLYRWRAQLLRALRSPKTARWWLAVGWRRVTGRRSA